MKKVIVLMALVAFSALAMAEEPATAPATTGTDAAKTAPADTTMKKETKTAKASKHKHTHKTKKTTETTDTAK